MEPRSGLPLVLAVTLVLVLVTTVSAQFDDFFNSDFFGGRSRGTPRPRGATSRPGILGSDSFFDRIFGRGRGGLFGRRPNPDQESVLRDGQRQYQVRLIGGRNSREGNVEVLIYDWREEVAGWRSVCDIGWTQQHAAAVCKQLGFPGPAVATRNGRFGFRSSGLGTLVTNCQVGEGGRGLRECLHQGVGRTASCTTENVAGVICGSDTSTTFSGSMEVRLRGRGGNRGDVEVKYEGQDWGPVCGDGFDLRDATVVCRQLGLGAARRSYLSGRRASGAFILSGVECTGRETNLGQCRSERGASVTCPGNQYSGAAVECGSNLPDLMVDAAEVQSSAYVSTDRMADLTCAMEENCLAATARQVREREPFLWRTRTRKLLRFTNKVWNNGNADYRPKADPSTWEWHSCHGHYHSEESFTDYDLTHEGTDVKAAQGHKASFCLEDSECRSGVSQRYQCYVSRGTRPPQGIRAGCADIYGAAIDCQWIDVTDIKSGRYVLRIRVNANRKVAESSFDNNQVVCNVVLDLEYDSVQVSNCRTGPL